MIKISGLNFGYNGVQILNNINFDVKPGQFVAVCGPNGCGKSTLLKIISGFIKPAQGSVSFNGKDISLLCAKEKARQIAFMPAEIKVPYSFTVMDIVVMGRYARSGAFGDFSKDDYDMARNVMEKFGISHLAMRSIHSLSSGEYQKMFLAQSIVQEPSLFLLDEPASHLDIKGQEELFSLLNASCCGSKITVIVVSHDINLPSKYADRVIMLGEKTVLCDGAPREVITKNNILKVYGVDGDVITHNNIPYFIAK